MGKSSAPPAPSAAELNNADGANARLNTQLNRVNQYGPQGSSTWSHGTGQFDEQQYLAANPDVARAVQAGQMQSGLQHYTQFGAGEGRQAFYGPGGDPNNWSQTITLSPEQQRLYDLNNQISTQFLQTGVNGLGQIQGQLGSQFNMSGIPGLSTVQGPQQGSLRNVDALGPAVSSVGNEALQRSLSTNGLQDMTMGAPGARDQVVQAMMSRIDPDLTRQEDTTRTRLLNQGIEQGSAGWNREMELLGRNRNDALMQAQLAGGQEQSRLSQLEQSIRGQQFGERQAQGNFFNTAAGQAMQQGLAGGAFANDARSQQFQQQMASAGLSNANVAQMLQQGLAAAGFNNTARGQGIQEQAFLRSLPLNEINALRTGSQMTMPQFGGYPTTNAQGGANNVTSAYNGALGANNANNAAAAGTANTVASSAALAYLAYAGAAF